MPEMKETQFGQIAFDWDFIQSTDFCLRVTDGTHDSPKEQTTGKHLITSKHIKGRNIDFDSAYLIKEDDFKKINLRSKVNQWDVIISMIGEYCGFSYVERNNFIDYAVKNVGLFKTGEKNKAFWLYYFLNSKIGRFILESNKSGTSQPYLSLGFLRELPILYPPTDNEAAKIVETLSSLDDKIDLLHRQNKTLEALAETLFRQWFVEEAEESWEKGKIEELFVLQRGFDLPSQNRSSGIYPIIASNGINGYHDEFKIKGPSVTTGRSGVLGKVIYTQEDFWPLNTTLFIKEYRKATPLFAYYFLKTLDLETLNGGSAVPTLNRNHVHEIETLIPSVNRINEFESLVKNNFQKIKSNQQQIKTLTNLRDTLLPKLMSGEIRLNYDSSDLGDYYDSENRKSGKLNQSKKS